MKKEKTIEVKVAACKHVQRAIRIKQGEWVEVLKPGQRVVTTAPKHTELRSDYFGKWMQSCEKVPGHLWAKTVTKKGKKEVVHIPIADMHPVQILRTIDWCMRLVCQSMAKYPRHYFGKTPAELLAPSQQWRTLLEEGWKKKIYTIIDRRWCGTCNTAEFYKCPCPPPPKLECSSWYQQALIVNAYYEL